MRNIFVETVNDLANVPIIPSPNDYVKDGIIYCGNCKGPRQCVVKLFGEERLVPCLCKCRLIESEKKNRELKAFQRSEEIKRKRKIAFYEGFQEFKNCTFDNIPPSDNLEKIKSYCNNWDKAKKENIGLLLWGSVGRGKTSLSACIANYLIDKNVSVLMTSLIKVANNLFSSYEKNEVLNSLNSYSLVVFDDLGVERKTDYMQEKVEEIINSRYNSKKPTIFTTNLSLDELKKASTVELSRMYDRVSEMTIPIKFEGESYRKIKHKEKMNIAKEIFS